MWPMAAASVSVVVTAIILFSAYKIHHIGKHSNKYVHGELPDILVCTRAVCVCSRPFHVP